MKRYVIVITVRNKPGVTSRVSGLFTRRGFNIDSFVGCNTKFRILPDDQNYQVRFF